MCNYIVSPAVCQCSRSSRPGRKTGRTYSKSTVRAAISGFFSYAIGRFLALAYGINMSVSGFSFVYPMVMSAVIYGGSLEFVAVSMLLSPYAPLQTFLMTLMIQARHLFYGISMLEKYKNLGPKKYYLIYAMCDETFSINYTAKIPDGVDRGWFYFFVTLLNQLYWVSGATIGGLLGSLIHFDTTGLDFVMTAMFVVIFMEQWMKEQRHFSELIGFAAAVGCLLLFGADSFLIPTMVCILAALSFLRKPITDKYGAYLQ